MANIKNIVFDFGGVLVDWNQRYYYRSYFNDDERMEFFLNNVCTNEWNLANDRGRTYAETTAELAARWPEYEDAIRMFPLHWGEMLRGEKPQGVALLRRLHAEGYRLYGLTNWSAENIHVAFERFDFLSLLEGTVVSGIEKTVKPEPEIYNILLERYSLRADESLFIDDRAENVEAARALGFHGVVFDNPSRAAAEIDRLLGLHDK
ncbi:MAG: HAD family hydrolase [Prevotella sp.]|mgnify:CR=1 FL=1